MPEQPTLPHSATYAVIACGGTGGHLFPGLAVGKELRRRGCKVTLMVSPKDVDQKAIASISEMGVVTLPAVGLQPGKWFRFMAGFCKSYAVARRLFAHQKPDIVMAMGGFVSAPPVVAGNLCGARTFLHESNSIPGRANRWLARLVDGAFVYFPGAGELLKAKRVDVSGMPVRPEFLYPMTAREARAGLGLKPDAPVVLIMGGSQGARGINDLALGAMEELRRAAPDLQFIHLTGVSDLEKVRAGYAAQNIPALVSAFSDQMGAVLAAASVAVSRAGASSLAELAARRLPAVLIPYPTAADNHQHFNALAFAECGAARVLEQKTATPKQLAAEILNLLRDDGKRAAMQKALGEWCAPSASSQIADYILRWPAVDQRAAQLASSRHLPVLNC